MTHSETLKIIKSREAHSRVDYEMLGAHAGVIVDTRNAMNGLALKGKLVKA